MGYEEFSFVENGSEYDYLHVDDNFLRLSQVIQIVPAEHDYVYFQQLVFTVVRPVPRVFWPGKPVDPGFRPAGDRRHEGRQPVDARSSANGTSELSAGSRWCSAAGCTAGWRGP